MIKKDPRPISPSRRFENLTFLNQIHTAWKHLPIPELPKDWKDARYEPGEIYLAISGKRWDYVECSQLSDDTLTYINAEARRYYFASFFACLDDNDDAQLLDHCVFYLEHELSGSRLDFTQEMKLVVGFFLRKKAATNPEDEELAMLSANWNSKFSG